MPCSPLSVCHIKPTDAASGGAGVLGEPWVISPFLRLVVGARSPGAPAASGGWAGPARGSWRGVPSLGGGFSLLDTCSIFSG